MIRRFFGTLLACIVTVYAMASEVERDLDGGTENSQIAKAKVDFIKMANEKLDQNDLLPSDPVGTSYCKANDSLGCTRGNINRLKTFEEENPVHQYAKSVGKLSIAFLQADAKVLIKPCTGTILDREHIVTAYHCLKASEGRAIAATFRVSYRDAETPVLRGRSFHVKIDPVEKYTDPTLDIAVLKLAKAIPLDGNSYVPGVFRRLPKQRVYPFAVSILGHPNGAPAYWISGCFAEEVEERATYLERYLFLSCNTEGGLSGAPIFGQNGIVGFHSAEAEGSLREYGIRSKGVELNTILSKHPDWGKLFGQQSQPTPAEVAAIPERIIYASDFKLQPNDLAMHLNHYQYAQGLNHALKAYGDIGFYSKSQDGWINITFQTVLASRQFIVKHYYDGRGLRRIEMRFEDSRASAKQLILAQAECVEVFETLRSDFKALVDPSFKNDSAACPDEIEKDIDPDNRPPPLARLNQKPIFKAFRVAKDPQGDPNHDARLMPKRQIYQACNDEAFIYLTLDTSQLTKNAPSCSVSISNFVDASS